LLILASLLLVSGLAEQTTAGLSNQFGWIAMLGMPIPKPQEHPRVVILNEIKPQDASLSEFVPA
jgi:hypothetical protein